MDELEYKVGMKVVALENNWGMKKGYKTVIVQVDPDYPLRTLHMPFKVRKPDGGGYWVNSEDWKVLYTDSLCYKCIHKCKVEDKEQCDFYEE